MKFTSRFSLVLLLVLGVGGHVFALPSGDENDGALINDGASSSGFNGSLGIKESILLSRDQWRKVIVDGKTQIEICPGRYRGTSWCRVPDTEGLNSFLGGMVTGEAYPAEKAIQLLAGKDARILEMREKGGTLEILFGARFDGHTVRRSGIKSIAVARPTEEDKAGVASASIILNIGVAGLIFVCLGVVLVGVFEVRASRRRLIDGSTMQEATVTRLREEQQRLINPPDRTIRQPAPLQPLAESPKPKADSPVIDTGAHTGASKGRRLYID
ncbi:hypothetical protein [Pseudomonas sp. PDM25]|uniref:hypothetical protein n=1 Tax=Pseudomonas sp. PDM25 TaxID=2854772 RepID=UPI001C453730|nr:hypothetical protein [Pseudomonas sp. PDM25]MBV7515648.1 hypothetical protein [Pseudomonas sp. PDM25]